MAAATSNSGATPLHLAAAAGSAAAVAALLDRGADPDAREAAWGQTPLMFAAARDRVEAIRALLDRGADPSITSKTIDLVADGRLAGEAWRRQRAVMDAFEAGDARATPSQVQAAVLAGRARYLSGEVPPAPENPNARPPSIETKGGLTALLHAVRQGHVGAAMALLDGGADVDQVGDGDGTSPLLMAAINAHFDLALMLVDGGADPDLASGLNGVTPLWATVNAEWQPRTRYPQPQQHGLQQATYLDVMAALLDAGADPNARVTRHPWYMVYSGCGNRNCGLVDTQGSTAFWRAAYATDLPAMRLLVEHGADPDIPTLAPPPRRARGGTTAENDEETAVPAVLPAAPGLWVATDLTTMGPRPLGPAPLQGGRPRRVSDSRRVRGGLRRGVRRQRPPPRARRLARHRPLPRGARCRREPARPQRLQRHPPRGRARGRRAHSLPRRAGRRRHRGEPARPDHGGHGQRPRAAGVADPPDGGSARGAWARRTTTTA